jgi:hypothetical protein
MARVFRPRRCLVDMKEDAIFATDRPFKNWTAMRRDE